MKFILDTFPGLFMAMKSVYPTKTSISQLNSEQFKQVLLKVKNESSRYSLDSNVWIALMRYFPLSIPAFRASNARYLTEENILEEVTTFYDHRVLSNITGKTLKPRKPAYNFSFLNKTITLIISPTLDCLAVPGFGNVSIGEVKTPSIERMAMYLKDIPSPSGGKGSEFEREQEIFSQLYYDMVMAKAALGLVTDGEYYLYINMKLAKTESNGQQTAKFAHYFTKAVKDLKDDSTMAPMGTMIGLLVDIFKQGERAYNRDIRKIYSEKVRQDVKNSFLSQNFGEEQIHNTFKDFWKSDGIEIKQIVIPSAHSIKALRLKQEYNSVVLEIDGSAVDPNLADKKIVLKSFDLLFKSLSKSGTQKGQFLDHIRKVYAEEIEAYNTIKRFNAKNPEEHRIRSAYLDINTTDDYFYHFTAKDSTGDLGNYVTSGPVIFLSSLTIDGKCSKVNFDDALDQLSRVHSASLTHGGITPAKIGVDGNGGTVFIDYGSATSFVFRSFMRSATNEEVRELKFSDKKFEKDLKDLHKCWQLKDPNKNYKDIKKAYYQLMERHENVETALANHGQIRMSL